MVFLHSAVRCHIYEHLPQVVPSNGAGIPLIQLVRHMYALQGVHEMKTTDHFDLVGRMSRLSF